MRLIKCATTSAVHLKHVLFDRLICRKPVALNYFQVNPNVALSMMRSYSQLGLMSLTARSDSVLSGTSNGWSGPPAGERFGDGPTRRLLDESAGSPKRFIEMPFRARADRVRQATMGPARERGPLVLTECDYSAPPDESLSATVMTAHLWVRGSAIASPDASWLNSLLCQGNSLRH